jgi:predicted cupin superfamily sugar epimerase
MSELPSAAEIIARLELQPHPEGGHYRETFRDTRVDTSGRALSTAIYFLWRAASARTGIASMRWRSGIITPAAR